MFGAFQFTSKLTSLYKHRLEGRNIRVLELLPGYPNEIIRCHLIDISLENEETLPYEALSYVWGDPKVTETILVDGHVCSITVNLAHALRRLRADITPDNAEQREDLERSIEAMSASMTQLALGGRALWIDAVCINQKDDLEKTAQVQLMRQVYSNATKTIAWLGDDASEDVAAAIESINYVHEVLHKGQLAQNLYAYKDRPVGDEQGQLSLKSLEATMKQRGWSDPLQSVDKFFSCPWWSRVWVVQEVVLGSRVQLLYGPRDIDAHKVAAFTVWHDRRGWLEPSTLYGVYRAWRRFHTDPRHASPVHMLNNFRDLKCTDPKDKVFGLAGIMAQEFVTVDYTKSVVQIYTEFIVGALRAERDLYVLSYVGHDEEDDHSDEWPSWVAQWNRPGDSWVLWNELNHWAASRRSVAIADLDLALRGTLVVKGLTFDTITRTSGKLLDTTGQYEDDKSFRRGFLAAYHDITGALESEGLTDRETSEADAFLQSLVEFSQVSFMDEKKAKAQKSDHFKVVWSIGHDRKIFRTSRGHLGLGSRNVREGDKVIVLDGAKLPHIVRHKAPEQGTWSFVGDCVVQGIMEGEVYDLNGENGVEEQVFNLV
ncbi:HET-domain-containing protein [Plenodomus tracheiphilus IPT5]|uniref:HET-domain-containing protein n=1 Tax=Plenodomus tracheiphilus IPT5 TaxID=1408161 RepID=A0A6A7BK57_9PLEO|nr:HET-domain-containing protein [Plenodomus tracheiphilus IPT5]